MKLRSPLLLSLLLLVGCGVPAPTPAPTSTNAKTCDAPSFASPVRYGGSPQAIGLGSIGSGDFDGNGTLDLAVNIGDDARGLLLILSGRGDGTFQASISNLDAPTGGGLAVADFDGDGRPDLAIGSSASASARQGLYILRAGQDGRFQQAAAYRAGTSASQVEAADLDGDGWKELVALTGSTISVLTGEPLASPSAFEYKKEYMPANCPMDFGLADVDGDGRSDLVVADGCGERPLWVLRGNGDRTFAAPRGVGPAGAHADSVTVADLNGDGHVDLVASFNPDASAEDCCDVNPSEYYVLLGHGDGTFEPPLRISGLSGMGRMITADFNGDGHADLAVANHGNWSHFSRFAPVVNVLLGRGDGRFGAPATYDVGASPVDIVAGDFDGDGRPDLATVSSDDSVAVLMNTCGK
jgi:hypothetical protein